MRLYTLPASGLISKERLTAVSSPTVIAMTDTTNLTFTYRNWRGQVSVRTVRPENIWFGVSEWHPGAQWFLRAVDVEKGELRDFALLDITFSPREKF